MGGAVSITGTASEVTVLGSAFPGALALNDNSQAPADTGSGDSAGYGPVLAGNSVRGSVTCSGNAGGPGPHTVPGLRLSPSPASARPRRPRGGGGPA